MNGLPGNHDRRDIGPVTLMCMHPGARDLMDRAIAEHEKLVRAGARKRRIADFTNWLFKESGMVPDVEEAAVAIRDKMMAQRREQLKTHPNPKYRRSASRDSIYGFAYWFFRWSGMVDHTGKATS